MTTLDLSSRIRVLVNLNGLGDGFDWRELDANGAPTGVQGIDGGATDVIGTLGADDITGTAGDNVFEGLGGNDRLDGGAGSDWVSYHREAASGGGSKPVSGDLDRAGRAELFVRHENGAVGWAFSHDSLLRFGPFTVGQMDASWTAAAVMDFTADGIADILWRHASGAVALWTMERAQGGMLASSRGLGAMDVSWAIAETGDYDGDGTNDILWRHESGYVAEWLLQRRRRARPASGSSTPVGR